MARKIRYYDIAERTCECGCGLPVKVGNRFAACGHHSYLQKGAIRLSLRGKSLSEETRVKIGLAHKGMVRSEETRINIGNSSRGRKWSEESKKNWRIQTSNMWQDEKFAEQTRGKLKEWWQSEEALKTLEERRTPEARLRKSKEVMGRHHSEETKKKISTTHKNMFQDNDFCLKMGKAWNVKPNKLEFFMLQLLNDLYPDQWKYTGDFSFTINGKSPDFVNCNGQKKIIELFGDYWHKGENPQDRVDIFKPFGFDTLVIWEKELKDMESVKCRIQEFHERKQL